MPRVLSRANKQTPSCCVELAVLLCACARCESCTQFAPGGFSATAYRSLPRPAQAVLQHHSPLATRQSPFDSSFTIARRRHRGGSNWSNSPVIRGANQVVAFSMLVQMTHRTSRVNSSTLMHDILSRDRYCKSCLMIREDVGCRTKYLETFRSQQRPTTRSSPPPIYLVYPNRSTFLNPWHG
ncbi:hypothetical protein F4861DRAFT_18075 [Xylaria intraflava]|nr:hypothetical protein F4861DRAFT_18075 [Xylaria intraflava]